MSKIKKINIHFSLPVIILREGKFFVAHTPALDLSTSASSFEKVKTRFDQVVKIFFEELMEKGTLDNVLADLGWKKMQKSWSPPKLVSNESTSFNIPLTV